MRARVLKREAGVVNRALCGARGHRGAAGSLLALLPRAHRRTATHRLSNPRHIDHNRRNEDERGRRQGMFHRTGIAVGEMQGEGRHAKLSRTLSGTNLVRAGDYNLRTVLQAIRLLPGTTRADLALRTGLTPPTIANITTRLVELGLVKVNGRRQGSRGQPALQLQVKADGAFSIGLNIDRDHLTLVTLDLAGAVRSRITAEIAFASPADVRQFVADRLDGLIEAGGVDRSRVFGVGVAIPDDLGRIALPGRPQDYGIWAETDVTVLLRETLPWTMHCDNDAAAAALGEAEYGSGFRNPTFFYLLINAGLGGGVVVDRRFHRGATARSGEIGLMPDRSASGRGAVVQDVVSLSALLARLESGGCAVTAVGEIACLQGKALDIVEQWLRDAVAALAWPVAAIGCLIDPDAVLIGGRLPLPLVSRLAGDLSAALGAMDLPSRAKVAPAIMAEDAPAVGAAILPFLEHLLPSDATLMQVGH